MNEITISHKPRKVLAHLYSLMYRLYQIYALNEPNTFAVFQKKNNNNKDGNLYVNVKTDIFVTKFNILVVLGQNTTRTTNKYENRLYQ